MHCRRPRLDPWVGNITWIREWQPLQYSCLKNFIDKRSLVGQSPWGHKESDTTEWLTLSLHPLEMLKHDLWCKGHQEQLNVGYCLKWELLESLHNECWDSFLTSFYYLTSTALAIRKISLWARNWNSLHYRISHAQGKSSKKTDIRSSSQGNSPATHPVVMTWKKQSKE